MKTMVEVSCQTCGGMFEVPASRLKHGRGKSCSKKCQYEATAKKLSELKIGKTIIALWEDRVCPVCQKVFRVKHNHPSKHCSITCAHANPEFRRRLSASLKNSPKARARQIEAAALMNATLTPAQRSKTAKEAWSDPETRQRIQEGITKRSETQEWRDSPHFQKGAAHPRYKGNARAREGCQSYAYKKWRQVVFARDAYTCQKCGQRGGHLNAHHIQPWAQSPELRYEVSNGLTLCEECHEKIHGKTRNPKTFKCVDCNGVKSDGRSPRCRSCAAKHSQRK